MLFWISVGYARPDSTVALREPVIVPPVIGCTNIYVSTSDQYKHKGTCICVLRLGSELALVTLASIGRWSQRRYEPKGEELPMIGRWPRMLL